ncbi:putative amino acid permease [Bisporella sp. PMI_857]|nr:putative amino acid permease [Bisporella sp. PMI_857]
MVSCRVQSKDIGKRSIIDTKINARRDCFLTFRYHWTALFAPPSIRVFLTWMQGWVTVFAWQAAVSSIFFQIATQVQGLVVLNYPDYDAKRWHGTLLMWAALLFNFAINVYGIRILPALQVIGGIFHIAFFVILVVPLVLLSPRSTPEFVFTEILNEGGWKNDGIAWCLGLLTVTFCFLGFDGAVHMSEEVRNAAVVIPKIIVQTIVINGGLAFVFVLVLLFCIGDVGAALSTPTHYPIIQIFYSATGSAKAATAMMSLITIIGVTSSLGVVASVSRLTWAFARDGGLPFPEFFAKIDGKHHVPFRAIGLVCSTVVVLSLINVASTTALTAMFALTTISLYISYIIPIACLIVKRYRKETIVFGPWNLGRTGMAVNIYAVIYGTFIVIFVPFPPFLPVTAENMNYCAPVFLGLTILLLFDWVVRGRTKFKGPLKELLVPIPEERLRRNS